MESEKVEIRKTNVGGFLKGVLFGALVFGTVALFTAPHSGAETRQIIRVKGLEVRDKTEEVIENVRNQVDSAIAGARQRTDELVERVGTPS
jgi:gas vesicle protein